MKNSLKFIWYIILFFIVFFANQFSFAQYNLVPNPSFETYLICPNTLFEPQPPPWYLPTNNVPVYYNACSTNPISSVPFNSWGTGNFQNAKSGNAYIGLYVLNNVGLDYRNYFQVKLLDSLQTGKCYYCEFYAVFQDNMKYACNNISALLTKTAVYVDTVNFPYGVLSANPQIYNYSNPIIKDTQNWVKVSTVFIAQGGEQYLTLGNFKYDSQTNYVITNPDPNAYAAASLLIDDVSVISLDSLPLKADAGKDTTISLGDSIFIGSLTNGITNIAWYNATGQKIDSIKPGFWVKPVGSTFYVVEQIVCGYYSRDTVYINLGTVPLKFINYKVIASKQSQKNIAENIWQTTNEINVLEYNILHSIDGIDFEKLGKLNARNSFLNNYTFIDENPNDGLNYYRIESVDINGKTEYSDVRTINIEQKNSNIIRIYPNPADDYVIIASKSMLQIKIFNQLGEIVYQAITPTENTKINTTSFIKGVYFVKCVKMNGEISTQKLIIENR